MKTLLSFLLVCFAFLISPTFLSSQVEFGLSPYIKKAGSFPTKSITRQTLRELFVKTHSDVSPKDFCVDENSTTDPTGFEADFNADGQTEILLLWHNGPAEAGCNSLFLVREGVNKSYELLDVFNLAPGVPLVSAIKIFPKGVQIYAQNTFTLADGKKETKGALFAVEKDLIIVVSSWVQDDYSKDGKRTVTQLQCGLTDSDFDNTKELYVKCSTHEPGAGKPDEKNLVDQYVLTLDYLPNHMRYAIYDSSGYDKIQKAQELTKTGARLIAREATEEDGILQLKEAITLNPFQTDARIALGRYYLRTGKPGDAERIFLQAIEIDPLTPESYVYLGDTYIKLNTLQQSLENFRTYLELKPNAKDRKAVESKIRQITIPKRR